jgi:hypothetical protein
MDKEYYNKALKRQGNYSLFHLLMPQGGFAAPALQL